MSIAKKTPKGTWFPQLHTHDEHSVKDGASSCETYVERTVELEGRSLCITNHGQAAGFARQYFACQDNKLKPIFGMEAYINEHRLLLDKVRDKCDGLRKLVKAKQPGAKDALAKEDAFLKESLRPSKHAIIIARNRQGYRNLVKMSTDSWLNGFYYVPRTDTKFLADHHEGLIYSTACIGGYIPTIARHDFAAGVRESKRLQKVFGPDSFFVEIMMTSYVKQRETNEMMLRLAHEVGAPTIITCDVHYARPSDQSAQSVMLLMRDGKTIRDKEAGEGVWQFEAKDLHWKTLEAVSACYQEHHSDYIPRETFLKSIRNTYALADSIEGWEFDCSLKLPGVFPNPAAGVRELVASGVRERLGTGEIPASGVNKSEYAARVRRELGVIEQKGFSEYFLILHDICKFARESGARLGPGRGSAGGSLVAYLLRITEIDPLRFNLLFERFLDVNRSDPPDIDLDFSPEHRDGIKDYIKSRYPATATIGTFARFGLRATLNDVGRVFEVDYRETQKATNAMPAAVDKMFKAGDDDAAENLSWDQVFELYPETKAWSERHPEAWEVVRTLKGLISHRGKNAAGVLIAPADAFEELPLMKDPNDGTIVTAFPDSQGDGVTYKGREVSRLGLLKMDILGVRNLNIAPRAVEILERETGEKVVLETLPLDDADSLAVAGTGDVPGVFQLDTHTTRPILRRVGIDTFGDLAFVTALARPGPLKEKIHEQFAKLKKQGDTWKKGIHESLHDVLEESRGLMIYQEDVMFTVHRLGGLPMAQANAIRKVIGKKLDKAAFEPHRLDFVNGGVALGHKREFLEDTWAKILPFAQYGFNKAHAVAYMLTAYRMLYMLAHYPLHYFAALLAETPRGKKGNKDDEHLIYFMRAAMARKLPVLAPNVLHSGVDFDVNGEAIRYGLGKIKGVAGAADEIVRARAGAVTTEATGEPTAFLDLLAQADRRKCHNRVWQTLILAGACDGLKLGRPLAERITHEGAMAVKAALEDASEPIERRNAYLVALAWATRKAKTKPPEKVETFTPTVLRDKERELIGLALSWWASKEKDELRVKANLTPIAGVLETGVNHFGVLAEVARMKTHKGRRGLMAFLTLADETGMLDNVTIWSEQWKAFGEKLKKGKVVAMLLRRKENEDHRYGRYSYFIDDGRRRGPTVVGLGQLRRDGA